jgi:hypothetical protein
VATAAADRRETASGVGRCVHGEAEPARQLTHAA